MNDRLTLTRLARHIRDLVGGHAEWEELAECSQTDPDAFFPERGQSVTQALRVCNGTADRPACPVRQQCLEAAVARREWNGVWGGLRERDLRKIVKPLKAADRKRIRELKAKAKADRARARAAKAEAKADRRPTVTAQAA